MYIIRVCANKTILLKVNIEEKNVRAYNSMKIYFFYLTLTLNTCKVTTN